MLEVVWARMEEEGRAQERRLEEERRVVQECRFGMMNEDGTVHGMRPLRQDAPDLTELLRLRWCDLEGVCRYMATYQSYRSSSKPEVCGLHVHGDDDNELLKILGMHKARPVGVIASQARGVRGMDEGGMEMEEDASGRSTDDDVPSKSATDCAVQDAEEEAEARRVLLLLLYAIKSLVALNGWHVPCRFSFFWRGSMERALQV
jgi:hypothetical protein